MSVQVEYPNGNSTTSRRRREMWVDRAGMMLVTKLTHTMDHVINNPELRPELREVFEITYVNSRKNKNLYNTCRQFEGYNEKNELVALNLFTDKELRRAYRWHSKSGTLIPATSKHFVHHNWTELIPTLESLTGRKILTETMKRKFPKSLSR